jgi:hypothetical protein
VNSGLEYLEDHPDLWRWMNRCPACGAVGHRPELPEGNDSKTDALSLAAKNLRSLFCCLPIYDDGRCQKCHTRTNRWGPRSEGFGIDE